MLAQLLGASVMLASAAVFAAPSGAAADGPWSIENGACAVTLTSDGGISLRSMNADAAWNAEITETPVVSVKEATASGDGRVIAAELEIDGAAWAMTIDLAPGEALARVGLHARDSLSTMTENFEYPFPIRAPDASYKMVVPHKSGLLFGVEDAAISRVTGAYETYQGNGLSMPWYGMTDVKHGGLMTILETPFDSGAEVRLSETGDGQAYSPRVYWRPTFGKAGYERRLTFRLFDEGGYVEMCKYYRERLIERGEFVTLRQKALAHPQLERMIGALYLKAMGDEKSQEDVIRYFSENGADRLVITSSLPPEKNAEWIARGYLMGDYRIYTDMLLKHPDGQVMRETHTRGYVGEYPEDAYHTADGEPIRGYNYSETRKSTYRCSILQMPLQADLLPPLVEEFGYNHIFLDVTTAMPARECYHPKHRIDRIGDTMQKIAMLKHASALGIVVGSEDGSDWCAPYVEYLEGLAMPRRFGHRPSATARFYMENDFEPSEDYMKINLNERVRAPLWNLVYHDCMATTWRWDHTPDMYTERQLWDKHDLFTILFGDMPIVRTESSRLESKGERMMQTYRDCAGWLGKVGWDEMVDHRALTEDWSVQESRFSSGWAVTVNFSEKTAFAMSDGAEVEPMSFETHRWR